MLNSTQRAYLRALGQHEEPVLQIGKGGISPHVIKQADDALEARELIKVRLLRNTELSLSEATRELCDATDAQAVQQIGRIVLLYRASKKKPNIVLP